MKNKGLNKKTHKKTQKILKMLPKENFYRVGMQKWLKKTWKIHEKLKITGSLTVTTDALESGNGVWKNILKRSPSKEVTHLSLLTPLIFGKWTRSKIKKYLNNDFCKIREIKEWCNENLPISQRKLKKNPPPNTTKIINILPNIRRKKQTKDAQKGLHIH